MSTAMLYQIRQIVLGSVPVIPSLLRTALFSVCLIVFSATNLFAATYYVSPTGLDSNTGLSVTTPWRTIGKAVATVVAGDTVYIRAGRYFEHNRMTRSGTSGARITFEAYPDDLPSRPILDGTGGAAPKANFWTNPSIFQFAGGARYVTLRGLEFTNAVGSDQIQAEAGSSFLILDKLVIHDGYGAGIRLYNSWDSVVSNSIIYNEFASGNTDCLSLGADPSGSGGRHTIRNNVVFNCSDDGIDTWHNVDNIIENNTVYHTGYSANGSPSGGDGNGFKLGPPGNNIVRNNISVGNYRRGFDDNGGSNVQLWNNIAYNNPVDYRTGLILVSQNRVIDPQFADMDSASPNFLHLLAGSPAIDAGINVGLPYNGSAPDIGAYEYGVSVVDTTPPAAPTGLVVR